MIAGWHRCRCCGMSFPAGPDIPLDERGVCDGCRAFAEPCSQCDGAGAWTVPVCCGQPAPDGECCGDPLTDRTPCDRCGGSGDEPGE